MRNFPPQILISPSTEQRGTEFADLSISLSNHYGNAIVRAGGLPVVLAATDSRRVVSEAVRRSEGVMLTGGDDVSPHLYNQQLPETLAKTVTRTEPERDRWELMLLEEVFRQRKPLFCICRGHQILNVAMGGDLIVDIPTQVENALNHRRMDRKMEPVHEVALTPGSIVATISSEHTLGVNSTHHQAIGRLAKGLKATAQSSDGVIEAVELSNSSELPYLLSVQFHPERLTDQNEAFLNLFRSFIDACAGEARKNL